MASFAADAPKAGAEAAVGNAAAALGATSTAAIGVLAAVTIGVGAAAACGRGFVATVIGYCAHARAHWLGHKRDRFQSRVVLTHSLSESNRIPEPELI